MDEQPPTAAEPRRVDRTRMLDLGLVLLVGLGMPILGSLHALLGGAAPKDRLQQDFRLWSILLTETTSLAVLWHVLVRQGRGWKDITGGFSGMDTLKGVGLFLVSSLAPGLLLLPLHYLYRFWYGHALVPKDLGPMFGFGISVLSISFAWLNPFFEELIVRGYVMSEVLQFGGGRWLAILISVALQVSYHLYQGWVHLLGVAIVFAVFSAYYAWTRRIFPIVTAHLILDLIAVLRGAV